MERAGRMTALVIALLFNSLFVGMGLWLQAWQLQPFKMSISMAVFSLIAFPIAWLLGFRYDQLLERSSKDALTKVCNRSFLQDTCTKLFRSAKLNKKRISLSIIDVNDFKHINDTFGHLTGDRVLQQIASALQNQATRGEIIARYGGDEFIMLCPYADAARTLEIEKGISRSLEQLSLRSSIYLSVSIGTAVFPDDGSNLEALTEVADKRMYAEKCSLDGRNSMQEAREA